MAYFKCPRCKVIFKRDIRKQLAKHFLTKSGCYLSSCNDGTESFCKPIKRKKR